MAEEYVQEAGADDKSAKNDIEELEEEEERHLKESCFVCGERFYPDFLEEIDSKYYCELCRPDIPEIESMQHVGDIEDSNDDNKEFYAPKPDIDFTVGDLIKEAWQKTKGAKAEGSRY